jgi:hypothetical protein
MPKKEKNLYGKFYHDMFEFRKSIQDLFSNFTKEHPLDLKTNNDLVDLRNKTIALLNFWIGSKKIESKFGIKIPLQTTTSSIKNFLEKQARSYNNNYKPCEICGEKRITHYCHIIPRNTGGPSDEKNYLYLCPLHHHLFDHNRLNKEEWEVIDFSTKIKASQEYAKRVRLVQQQRFWQLL